MIVIKFLHDEVLAINFFTPSPRCMTNECCVLVVGCVMLIQNEILAAVSSALSACRAAFLSSFITIYPIVNCNVHLLE